MRHIYPEKQDILIRAIWDNDNRGQIRGHDDQKAGFDSPVVFDGQGNLFYPDELFLGAITSCFITTFISIIKRFGEEEMLLENISIKSDTSLLRSNEYIADEININGTIVFVFAEDVELVKRCIVLSRKNCHILASINPEIAIKIKIELVIKEDEDGNRLEEEVIIQADKNV